MQGSFSQPLRPFATLCTSVEACNIIAISRKDSHQQPPLLSFDTAKIRHKNRLCKHLQEINIFLTYRNTFLHLSASLIYNARKLHNYRHFVQKPEQKAP